MLIKELTEPQATAPNRVEPTVQDAETPAPEEIKAVQDLLGTIDPQKEQPQTLLNKLNSWIKQYPLLDKVTDLIPQTRLVKAVAAAAEAIEAGDSKTALNALAGAVGGGVAQAARAVNVGSALAQGDVRSAALAAGGNVAKVAKGVGAVTSLAQGDVASAVGNVNKGAGQAVTALQAKMAPKTAPDEVERLKQLANV